MLLMFHCLWIRIPFCISFDFCRPQDPLKRANGVPLPLTKPLFDAIQKFGRSLWYDVTGAQEPVESPLLTSSSILSGSALCSEWRAPVLPK